MKKKLAIYAQISLVVIGCLQSLSHMTGLHELAAVSYLTAASPTPFVFNQVNGVEPFFQIYKFTLTDDQGNNQEFELSNQLQAELQIPHRLMAALSSPFAMGLFLPKSVTDSALEYAFCNPGFLKNKFAYAKSVQSIHYTITAKNPRVTRPEWGGDYECNTFP